MMPNGKNNVRARFLLLFSLTFFASCSTKEKDPTAFANQVKRGEIFISKDGNSFIFLDIDSTFILNRIRGDIAYKELGIVRTINNELVFFQGIDLEPNLNVNFSEGDSETISINFSKQFFEDNPGAVLSIMDTLIYSIDDTVVVINKRVIFDKFQTLNKPLPEYFNDWKIWNRIFISDLKLKSRNGYMSMFHDGNVDKIQIGKKNILITEKTLSDSICFKMTIGPTYLVCSNCPTRLKLDTLFLN